MLELSYKDKPDFQEYEKNLTEDCRIFIDYKRLMRKVKTTEAKMETYRGLLEQHLYINTYGMFSEVNPTNVKRYLLDYAHIPEGLLSKKSNYTGDYGVSLDINKVLTPLYNKGYCQEFLDLYITFKNLKSSVDNINGYVKQLKPCKEDNDLRELRYKVTKSATGRYYTNNANIQAIGLDYVDCIVAPPGYVLVWGDLDQVDLRVAWEVLLNEGGEDSEIFQKYSDRYEAFARIVEKASNREFSKDVFKEDRDRYKVSILARTYGAKFFTLMQSVGNKHFVNKLNGYFDKNKRYKAYCDLVDRVLAENKEVTLRDYFGVERTIKTSLYDAKSVCLNTPVQSTSNSIIMNFTNKTLQKYREFGYGSDKIRLYMIRHDESVFMVSLELLEKLETLKQHTVIQVDNWDDITMPLNIGKNYSIPDEEYMKVLDKLPIDRGVKKKADIHYTPIESESAVEYNLYQYEDKMVLCHKYNKSVKYVTSLEGDIHFSMKRYIENLAYSKLISKVTVHIVRSDFNPITVEDRGCMVEYVKDSEDTADKGYLKGILERVYSMSIED